jgi:uncharacterized protein
VLLTLENPNFRYCLRGTDAGGVWVNDRRLTRSFILTPSTLVEDWRPLHIEDLQPADFGPLLVLEPVIVILGTGKVQRFPSQAVLAACLTRGIGIEAMDNAAAARTFNVLATEGRRVAAGFLLESY